MSSTMLSFSQIYEACLENISLVRIKPYEKNENNNNFTNIESPSTTNLTTLGEIIRISRHILFYIMRSSNHFSMDSLKGINNLMAQKNSQKNSSSNSSPAKIKRLFGSLKRSSSKKKHSISAEISTILIDLDSVTDESLINKISHHGFYYMPPQQYITKSRLLRSLNFGGLGSAIIVLDSSDLSITTYQGRRLLMEDPNGENFPWIDPPINEVFKGKFLRNSTNSSSTTTTTRFDYEDFSTLKPSVKGLYFGAKWCPPCRIITEQLKTAYEKIQKIHPTFEIIFCSSDRSAESFAEHFKTMPWLAFPYDNEKLAQLTRLFDVNGIPTFILIDENNKLITRQGRTVLLADPMGNNYPWKRQSIYELTENTVHRIIEMPSLILFTEGSPGDTEFSLQILKPCADSLFLQLSKSTSTTSENLQNNEIQCQEASSVEDHNSLNSEKSIPLSADPIQVFYTGEDPICDYILDSIGQGQADLPLLVICDLLTGHMAICDKPDVSESIVFDFVSDYREGKIDVVPLPSNCLETDKRVAGIKLSVIEQIISNQQIAVSSESA